MSVIFEEYARDGDTGALLASLRTISLWCVGLRSANPTYGICPRKCFRQSYLHYGTRRSCKFSQYRELGGVWNDIALYLFPYCLSGAT